jgi:outer membrane lipoprotein-sorting protein
MSKKLTLTVLSILGTGSLSCQPLPNAEEVLTRMTATYRAAQKYLIAGTTTLAEPDFPEPRSSQITFAVELPDKMRIEGDLSSFGMEGFSGSVLIVLDGEFAWIYDDSEKQYYKIHRSSPRGSVGKFEANRQPDLARPEQFTAYFHFFFTVAQRQKYLDKNRVNTVAGVETLTIGGNQVECYVVHSDIGSYAEKAPGSSRETIWVGVKRPITWREDRVGWLSNGLQEHSRTDLTSVLMDEPLPKDTFVFTPPKGSKETPFRAR